MPACFCCRSVIDTHKAVDCCVCSKTFNIDCVKITSAEARRIHLKTGITWTCKNCLQLGDDLNSLKSVIVSLQEEIKVLKETVLTSPPSSSSSLLESEKIIQEITDRDRRKTNIMIFGSRETKCNNYKEQIDVDITLVSDICTEMNITNTVSKVFRLGKFDSSKASNTRPMKVVFSSESTVLELLRNISKLKNNPKFSSLSISRDRTPMQAEIHKQAKLELQNRLKAGESNLKIKYNKGIPSVVSSLN